MIKIIVKVHSTPNGKLIAICDPDLVGRVFEEGEKQLNLDCEFYRGEERSESEVREMLKDCCVVNAVGEKAVGILVEMGLVSKDNVQKISDVEYAQCVVEKN